MPYGIPTGYELALQNELARNPGLAQRVEDASSNSTALSESDRLHLAQCQSNALIQAEREQEARNA